MANTPVPNRGTTLAGIAALGLAAFGAWKWRKSERAKGTYDGDGDGRADNAPTASNIDVGTTSKPTA